MYAPRTPHKFDNDKYEFFSMLGETINLDGFRIYPRQNLRAYPRTVRETEE